MTLIDALKEFIIYKEPKDIEGFELLENGNEGINRTGQTEQTEQAGKKGQTGQQTAPISSARSAGQTNTASKTDSQVNG